MRIEQEWHNRARREGVPDDGQNHELAHVL